jgi:CRP/FNR family cyclic AMP-dependent transcriptional regulator
VDRPKEIDFREFARAVGTVLNYPPGQILFEENDPPKFMYIVLSGLVEITSHNKKIEEVGSGDAFGLLSLLDEKPSTITARTVQDSELAVVDRKKFRFMVEEMPNFVWYVMDELAQKLRNTNAAL